MIYGLKRKNQKQVRGNDYINNQIFEIGNWAELISKKGDMIYGIGYEEVEEVEGEDGIEGMRIVRGVGGEEGIEIKVVVEESQSSLGDVGINIYLFELENQKEMGSEDVIEVRVSEQRNKIEFGNNDIKIQRFESESQGQLVEVGGIGEQVKGESILGNGVAEKKNWGEGVGEDCRKLQRFRRKDQRLRLGEVDGKIYQLEWKNQENFRDGNDVDI